jgi:hypothetical protein
VVELLHFDREIRHARQATWSATLAAVERPSRLPLYVGIALLALGWIVVAVGWYQSGRQDLETGQIPYVISGGFGGFGLILMGVIGILADVVRQAETKLRRSADELHKRMQELAEVFVSDHSDADEDDLPPARSASRRTSDRRSPSRPRARARRSSG